MVGRAPWGWILRRCCVGSANLVDFGHISVVCLRGSSLDYIRIRDLPVKYNASFAVNVEALALEETLALLAAARLGGMIDVFGVVDLRAGGNHPPMRS